MQKLCEGFWPWAMEHYWLAFFIIVIVLQGSINLFARVLRSVNVMFRGWPSATYMDADGDIVLPKGKK